MIKRPLVWVLGAYLAGMFLAWHKVSLLYSLLLTLLTYLIIYLLMFKVKKTYINRRDSFLWCLPLLLFLGFFTLGGQLVSPAIDLAFEEKAECELSGKITMIVEKPLGKALYVKDNSIFLSSKEPYLCENVIIYCSDQQNYLIGNQITVYGEIQKFSEASNPGQFNEKMYYQIENIDYKVKADVIIITDARYSKFQAVLSRIKQKLIMVYDTILSEKESGALIAMLLGEKYLLDEEIKQLYQENGISHILAISGLHVSLIGMFVFKLFKKLKIPLIPATAFSILFLYSYGILTNFSVSTNRAVVMMVVMLLSSIFGKTYDMLSATSLSAFLILLINPMQIFSAGFLLSFGAVLGIAVLMPCLHTLFPSKNPLLGSLFVSISAQAMTMPMVLSFYYQFPAYSVFINLLILPCMSVMVLTALLAGIVGVISLPIGVFLIGGANYILKFYEWICKIGSNLPSNLITVGKPDLLRILLYMAILLIFIWGVKHFQRKGLIILLIAAVIILFLPTRNVGLEIAMLDVGQGEAIFMETETKATYLIDGGSNDISKVGVYRIQPFLLSNGVDRIDFAIITHSDSDHISGLKELLVGNRIIIKHLVLPNTSLRDEAYMELETLAKNRRIEVLYIEAGDTLINGDIRITCLHPTSDYQAQANNAYSTVLSLSYGEFDMLLTGDLQQDGEELLMQTFQRGIYTGTDKSLEYSSNMEQDNFPPLITDYDVLKVAHHGSKNSTYINFLQVVQPEFAIISCGKDNFYGHPHKELLERLQQIGSDVSITYKSGAIFIKTDGKKMEISEYKRRE